LWLQGHPMQAIDRILQTIETATKLDESLALALHWGTTVFLWAGDLDRAKYHIDWHITRSETFSIGAHNLTIGHGMRASLAIRRGNVKEGVEDLQRCLERFHPHTFELHSEVHMALIQGFIATGRFAEASRLADDTIARVEEGGEFCYMPELLRLKGKALLATSVRGEDGEAYFLRSLEMSRRQGALAWELRTSIDLAALKADQGRPEVAREILAPVFFRFDEGTDTADLRLAQDLLATLA